MQEMFFSYNGSFNQNISNWDVDNVTNWFSIFFGCPIQEEYKPPKFR
jgi:surface protein